MRRIFLTFFLLSALPPLAFAETQTITLKDGSQIKGELLSVANGVYTFKTPALGEIHLSGNQVTTITNGPTTSMPAQNTAGTYPPQAAAANPNVNQQMQNMQTQLMSNPELMSDIQKMMEDPEIIKAISDPAFTQAVTSKDVNAIQANPHTQQLINNPKMKTLMEKLRQSK